MSCSSSSGLPCSTSLTRRDFLGKAASLAALLGLGSNAIGQIAAGLADLENGSAPVLWLQGQSCSGCTISLLNSYPRTPLRLLTQDIDLKFHPTLSTATGEVAVAAINEVAAHPGYVLVVEGAVPLGLPEACLFAHQPFAAMLKRVLPGAKAVVSIGACACHGGVPGAEGNPTGAASIREFMKREGFKKPLVNVPGCPPHPDWIVGTLVQLLRFGMPALDRELRPLQYFRRTVHDQCSRFAQYERKEFATRFGEDGCLFKLGCQGPITQGDCTVRKWNGVSDCIEAGGGCVGCASADFPRKKNFPMYYKVGREAVVPPPASG